MKRLLILAIAGVGLIAPAALWARSNHAGWHGAAPVKRGAALNHKGKVH